MNEQRTNAPEEKPQWPLGSSGFERTAGVLTILVCGWLWQFIVSAICHGYVLDVGASYCAGPFWGLAILWAGWPSKLALKLSGFVTFALVALAYGLVDLTSDAQASIALGMLLIPIPFLSALAYGVGIAIERRRRRMSGAPP